MNRGKIVELAAKTRYSDELGVKTKCADELVVKAK